MTLTRLALGNPVAGAALDIQLPSVATLAGNNVDTTGGFTDIGRRQYTVRYAGQYAVSEFEDMVLAWLDGNPVRQGAVIVGGTLASGYAVRQGEGS